jgi:hypothetical protein
MRLTYQIDLYSNNDINTAINREMNRQIEMSYMTDLSYMTDFEHLYGNTGGFGWGHMN